jgi:hypothetical protein
MSAGEGRRDALAARLAGHSGSRPGCLSRSDSSANVRQRANARHAKGSIHRGLGRFVHGANAPAVADLLGAAVELRESVFEQRARALCFDPQVPVEALGVPLAG